MDQAVNTFLELNEDTEVSEVTNLSCVLATCRILVLDCLPWIFLELLDTERHLTLFAVESDDNCINFVTNLEEVLS